MCRMPIFLYNYSTKQLHGIWVSTTAGEWKLNPAGELSLLKAKGWHISDLLYYATAESLDMCRTCPDGHSPLSRSIHTAQVGLATLRTPGPCTRVKLVSNPTANVHPWTPSELPSEPAKHPLACLGVQSMGMPE